MVVDQIHWMPKPYWTEVHLSKSNFPVIVRDKYVDEARTAIQRVLLRNQSTQVEMYRTSLLCEQAGVVEKYQNQIRRRRLQRRGKGCAKPVVHE